MFKRICAALLVACGTLVLGGCFSQQQTITVHDDGRAEIALIITFPKEMETVRDAIEARAAIDPRLAMLEGGFCKALNDIVPESGNVRLKAREITSPQSFTCRVDVAVNDFPKAISENGAIAVMAGLSPNGDRQFRYEMQTMPLALGELAWRSMVEQQFREQGVQITPEQVNAI
ncbi:MAG: hypothetical protein ACR2O4_01415, partial [Hyphomicrobiaceae bacterium]